MPPPRRPPSAPPSPLPASLPHCPCPMHISVKVLWFLSPHPPNPTYKLRAAAAMLQGGLRRSRRQARAHRQDVPSLEGRGRALPGKRACAPARRRRGGARSAVRVLGGSPAGTWRRRGRARTESGCRALVTEGHCAGRGGSGARARRRDLGNSRESSRGFM